MLVLTRRLDESIMIGNEVEIRIVQVRGSGDQAVVRLGISAPKHVTILRKEVFDEVVSANQQDIQLTLEIPADLLKAATLVESPKKLPTSEE